MGGAENSGEGGTEESEREEGGGVEVDRAEGEGGKPLGLGDGEAVGEPGEESAPKEDLLPEGGEDEGVGEKGEEGLAVARFEKFPHGGLGFKGKTEKEKDGGAKCEKKKDGEKKGKDGSESKGEVLDGGRSRKTPKRNGILARKMEEKEGESNGGSREKRRVEISGEREGGEAEEKGRQGNLKGGWVGRGGRLE